MTETQTERIDTERRIARRIQPKGAVMLELDGRIVHGRISNLSATGLLVALEDADCVRPLDPRLVLQVRLDNPVSSWIELEGHVVRIEECALAIELDHATPAYDALIGSEQVAAAQNRRTPCAVVVGSDEARRRPVVDRLRSVGYVIVEAATPLEAVVRVGEASYEPQVIAVAETMLQSNADELRSFMLREHPDAEILAFGPDGAESTALDQWLEALRRSSST
ncbi:MAG: PilZ domain-containing protein [Kofleriaceae bacterium]